MRFLRLQVFCFSKAAREFSVTLDSYAKGFLPLCVLPSFSLASIVLCLVLARPSPLRIVLRSPSPLHSRLHQTPDSSLRVNRTAPSTIPHLSQISRAKNPYFARRS